MLRPPMMLLTMLVTLSVEWSFLSPVMWCQWCHVAKNNQLEMPMDVSSSSSISFLICLTTDTIMVNKDDNIENI